MTTASEFLDSLAALEERVSRLAPPLMEEDLGWLDTQRLNIVAKLSLSTPHRLRDLFQFTVDEHYLTHWQEDLAHARSILLNHNPGLK